MTFDQELRERAMELAMLSRGMGDSADDVIAAAQKYYDFLKNSQKENDA